MSNGNCRNYLIATGKAYPKSACEICGSMFNGGSCKYPEIIVELNNKVYVVDTPAYGYDAVFSKRLKAEGYVDICPPEIAEYANIREVTVDEIPTQPR